MKFFDYLLPGVNFIGPGSVEVVGERAKLLEAERMLLVTDDFLNNMENGPVDKVRKNLQKAGLDICVFSGVEPNPKDKNVREGRKLYEEENCDLIVTVGGGSPHDCGKAIGVAVSHEGDLYEDYAGIEKLENDTPSLISVNTTAGTASEVTRHAVITDTSQEPNVKFVIVSWRNVPEVSINDPELMLGKPPALTAATGMDALTHSLETYVSTGANTFTDAAAEKSMKLIAENLRNAVYNGDDLEARSRMAEASVLSGFAFNNGGLGYVHAMAHQLGGLYDMPHGIANAILLPYVEEFNLGAKIERFARIAEIFGVRTEKLSLREAAEAGLDAIRQLSEDIGIPGSLSESKFDIRKEDFAKMAELALEDGNAGTNPRKGNKEDLIEIFENAY